MATWKELKAQGIKRCCGMLYNRRTKKYRQCRYRAVEGSDWCAKHKPIMDYWSEFNSKAIESCNEPDEDGEEEDG